MSDDSRGERPAHLPHQDLPAPPDEIESSGAEQQHASIAPVDLMQAGVTSAIPSQPKQPLPRRTSRLFKVLGTLQGVLGGLLLLSLVAAYVDEVVSTARFGMLAVLLLAALAGGVHLYRKGWETGHDAKNLMSVLPAAVLVVLITMGTVESATQPPSDDLSKINAIAGEYKSAAALVWTDYADPEISGESWVRTVDTHMPAMQRAVEAFSAEVATIQDQDLRAKLQALANVLREEVDLLTDLRNAVASHDVQGELAANRRISDLAKERVRVVRELIEENGEASTAEASTAEAWPTVEVSPSPMANHDRTSAIIADAHSGTYFSNDFEDTYPKWAEVDFMRGWIRIARGDSAVTDEFLACLLSHMETHWSFTYLRTHENTGPEVLLRAQPACERYVL